MELVGVSLSRDNLIQLNVQENHVIAIAGPEFLRTLIHFPVVDLLTSNFLETIFSAALATDPFFHILPCVLKS